MKMNFERYNELTKQYKIAYGPVENPDDFDVIYQYVGTGYAHTKYRIVKNAPKLSENDLAIICDRGNLCFGYRSEGGIICVYTD